MLARHVRPSSRASNGRRREHGRRRAAEAALRARGYDRETLARAITLGIGVGNRELHGAMPRWSMGEGDLRDLVDYLEGLGGAPEPRP